MGDRVYRLGSWPLLLVPQPGPRRLPLCRPWLAPPPPLLPTRHRQISKVVRRSKGRVFLYRVPRRSISIFTAGTFFMLFGLMPQNSDHGGHVSQAFFFFLERRMIRLKRLSNFEGGKHHGSACWPTSSHRSIWGVSSYPTPHWAFRFDDVLTPSHTTVTRAQGTR